MNLLRLLTGQIKAGTCDRAVEGKRRAGGFCEGERGRRKREIRRWRNGEREEHGSDPHGTRRSSYGGRGGLIP